MASEDVPHAGASAPGGCDNHVSLQQDDRVVMGFNERDLSFVFPADSHEKVQGDTEACNVRKVQESQVKPHQEKKGGTRGI